MNDAQQQVLEEALNDYAGWFDETEPDDAKILSAINDALVSKTPLDFAVTTEALQSYRSKLVNDIDQTTNRVDQINYQHAIDVIDQLLDS